MARKDKQRPGYARLLDAWIPPDKSQEPIGCLATTFTFSAAFFEEECLARFLQLETDPVEDGIYHLIEREEKLAQVACAAVLVDQHHCRGARSLRWDMLPARLPRGILHAKISLLCWTDWTRLIVASANLTEDGYRRNQEVFAVLDFHAASQLPESCLTDITAFLREAATFAAGHAETPSPALQRWHSLLDHAEATAQTAAPTSRRSGPPGVHPVLVGPGRPGALSQMGELWPSGAPPSEAWVVSPFFDPPEAPNRPARELWECLRKRGECAVNYCVATEGLDGDGATVVQAPQSLREAQPRSGRALTTRFHAVDPFDAGVEGQEPVQRPLHAKCLSLEDDTTTVYMIGSSNFTSAGLGPSPVNLEANVAFVVSEGRHPEARRALDEAFPKYGTLTGELHFQAADAASVDDAGAEECLPGAFGDATYDCTEHEQGRLRLGLTGTPPAEWVVRAEDDSLVLTEAQWQSDGRPPEAVLPWTQTRPPSGLWVHWRDAKTPAWWPVNIVSSSALPPPEELRNLPLDVLLAVLTSARPLHRALRQHLRTQIPGVGGESTIDPHKRVDTSQFLLQRSRRVSWALRSLRERLQRPVPNEHCLQWRLYGPVGVMAVAQALQRERQSEDEQAFLLSELALEVHRVQPQHAAGCLSPAVVGEALRGVVSELRSMIPDAVKDAASDMGKYVSRVWAVVLQ